MLTPTRGDVPPWRSLEVFAVSRKRDQKFVSSKMRINPKIEAPKRCRLNINPPAKELTASRRALDVEAQFPPRAFLNIIRKIVHLLCFKKQITCTQDFTLVSAISATRGFIGHVFPKRASGSWFSRRFPDARRSCCCASSMDRQQHTDFTESVLVAIGILSTKKHP